jgi:peptidoglycan/LPS O-acetylase OafA/YrhL
MQPVPPPLLTHPTYRADIDGLRALAVLSVVIFHAFPTRLAGGFIGVDIFFVISGFLISTIIFGNLRSGSFSYLTFYQRRIRRIFPALVVVLLACLGLGWFGLLAGEYQQVGRHTLGGIGFISNLMLWSEAGYDYFNTASESKPLLHLWSLAIEEQFYIIWPLLLVLLWKRGWNFVGVACSIALVSFCFNVLSFPEHAQAAFYSPLSRFWELIVGGLLAHALMHKAGSMVRYANAQSALGMALIIAGLVFVNSERAFPGWWALLPTTGAALLISAGPLAWLNRTVLSNPVAVWFGKISYPLYLWHWPLLSLAMLWNNEETPAGPVRLGLVLLAIGLAWLTYKFIELPIRVGNNRSTPQLIGAFCLVGLLATPVIFLNGFPGRNINKDETRVFLDQYKKLTRLGLSDYYQERCDFSNWATGKNKGSIDRACTATSGARPVYLLWGDSHGQALSFGIRKNIAPSVQLAQVITSGCKPKLHPDPDNGTDKSACQASNEFAIGFIKKHKPARVFIAQGGDHQLTDWTEVARLVEANQGELVLVGPVPQWRPSLPVIVARDLKAKRDYIGEGLDPEILEIDEKLHATYAGSKVRFVSVIDKLCRLNECRAKVPSYDGFDLLALDYGHLTPAGSDFVAKTALLEFLNPIDGLKAVSSDEIAPAN